MTINGSMAEVSAGGAIFKAGLQMVENAEVGDYILLHAGFAIQKIDENEALNMIKLIEEMNEFMNG